MSILVFIQTLGEGRAYCGGDPVPLTATFHGTSHPGGGSLLGHHILSRPRGHHPQLPTTYPLTTYLLPGLGKLTLLPISGYFLFLKHQPLSFPSLEQLKLNFLMVLSFQTKGWSLFLEYSFFIPSVVMLQGKVISYSMLRLFL